jgi:energy-coupling factor transporter ATP-binding protein EcfA2
VGIVFQFPERHFLGRTVLSELTFGWPTKAEYYPRRRGAFYLTLVPIRPRSRGERRSLRTFPGLSLRPSLAFNARPRRLSTPLLTPFNSTPPSELATRMQSALEAVGMLDVPLDTEVRSLSGGYKRRLALAIQLVRDPHVLCLDEPLAGLDWKARADVVALLDALRYDWSPYDRVGVVNADP